MGHIFTWFSAPDHFPCLWMQTGEESKMFSIHLTTCGYMYLEVVSTVASSWVLLHLLLAKMFRKQGRHMDSLGGSSFAAAFGGRSYRKYRPVSGMPEHADSLQFSVAL